MAKGLHKYSVVEAQNTALGQLGDDIEGLMKAVKYLST